jgi:tetratricopeptide (TPR) repeat protein
MWIKQLRLTARWLIALVVCGLYTVPLVAHPVLMFTVTSHKEPPKGVKSSTGKESKPSDETYPLTVTLGHQYLVEEMQGTRTIYDFDRLRILRVNLASKSYTDDSLYSDIGFRASEFQNRIMLGTALQAGKVAVNPMEPALMEQLFSMSNPKGQTTIEERHAGSTTEFFWGKQTLMSVSDRSQQLPAGYQSEYWRFLRYYAGGHPKIYAALASIQGVPERVTLVLTNMNTETREMILNFIRTEADEPYSLAGLSPASPDEAPYSTLRPLGPDAVAQLAERAETAAKARDAAFAQGRVLDALLSNMAILIMTGNEAGATAWIAQHRDAIQSDESAHAFATNLEPRDQAAAQSAVHTLTELHKKAGSAGYMLDVFEGNTLVKLGDRKGGIEHLLGPLNVNPYLLGAWNDLGDTYYQSFRADKAWACWDAARRVNPKHPMLLKVAEMESGLRATFPDFF